MDILSALKTQASKLGSSCIPLMRPSERWAEGTVVSVMVSVAARDGICRRAQRPEYRGHKKRGGQR